MSLHLPLLFGATLVGGGVTCVLGFEATRRWDDPGSTALGAYALVWGAIPLVSSVAGFFSESAATVTALLWWVSVIPWTLFALRYTGTQYRRRTVAIAVAPALAICPWLVAMGAGIESTLLAALGILVFIYFSGLVFLASVLVFRTTQRYDHLSTRLGLSLFTAGVLPALSMNTIGVLSDGELTTAGTVAYTVGVVGTMAALALALFRYDTFDSTPAAGTIGERAIARETDDSILIVDEESRVLKYNAAAGETLALSNKGTLGKHLSETLGHSVSDLADSETVDLETNTGVRQFDPQVTTLEDQHGRSLGSMVTLHDVTERELRRQRLEVLNRIMRHNLRNRISVIRASTEAVASEVSAEQMETQLETTLAATDHLESLSQKAKSIEGLLSGDRRSEADIDLQVLFSDIRDALDTEYPDGTIDVEVNSEAAVRGDPELLEFVVSNLVENALEHSDQPSVSLTAEVSDQTEFPLTVEIADDGPGIPDREIAVIESGSERQLEHGSGIGLWVSHWAVTDAGGALTFTDREPRGTLVTVELPYPPVENASE